MTTADRLKKLGFSDEIIKVPKRLVASVAGLEKTGKTNLALTAPEPIAYFDIDIGAEGVMNKFQERGKKIYRYGMRVIEAESQDKHKAMWSDFKAKIKAAWALGEGSVVVDTATEVYELARLAEFGKLTEVLPHHYGKVNSQWKELMKCAYDSPMNTILIHRLKPKWVNNTRTSEYEISGFNDTPFLVQINVITGREDTDEGSEWEVYVKDCRHNPNINGEDIIGFSDNPLLNFEFLINLVHGKGSK